MERLYQYIVIAIQMMYDNLFVYFLTEVHNYFEVLGASDISSHKRLRQGRGGKSHVYAGGPRPLKITFVIFFLPPLRAFIVGSKSPTILFLGITFP